MWCHLSSVDLSLSIRQSPEMQTRFEYASVADRIIEDLSLPSNGQINASHIYGASTLPSMSSGSSKKLLG